MFDKWSYDSPRTPMVLRFSSNTQCSYNKEWLGFSVSTYVWWILPTSNECWSSSSLSSCSGSCWLNYSNGSPSSITSDQDAPSRSITQTTHENQSPVIPHGVDDDSHDIEVAHLNNDPLLGISLSSRIVVPSNVHVLINHKNILLNVG